jgi:2-iminoacetate synthase ThiH
MDYKDLLNKYQEGLDIKDVIHNLSDEELTNMLKQFKSTNKNNYNTILNNGVLGMQLYVTRIMREAYKKFQNIDKQDHNSHLEIESLEDLLKDLFHTPIKMIDALSGAFTEMFKNFSNSEEE